MDSGKQTGLQRGGGVGEWDRLVMGSEGTYCMEHWVLYATNESWTLHQKLGMYCMVTDIM